MEVISIIKPKQLTWTQTDNSEFDLRSDEKVYTMTKRRNQAVHWRPAQRRMGNGLSNDRVSLNPLSQFVYQVLSLTLPI